eukprot:753559-Pyramimonas_sp.AAC.2
MGVMQPAWSVVTEGGIAYCSRPLGYVLRHRCRTEEIDLSLAGGWSASDPTLGSLSLCGRRGHRR